MSVRKKNGLYKAVVIARRFANQPVKVGWGQADAVPQAEVAEKCVHTGCVFEADGLSMRPRTRARLSQCSGTSPEAS